MEFATEMIAIIIKFKNFEVPTTLNVPIVSRKPHLKPFRDGFTFKTYVYLYFTLITNWYIVKFVHFRFLYRQFLSPIEDWKYYFFMGNA